MSRTIDIALIGATGVIGETLVQILEERDFPVDQLHLLAGAEAVGQSLVFRGKNVRVRALQGFDFASVQLAFFAAEPALTRTHVDAVRAAGCSLIDLSGGLAAEQAPAVVAEVNAQLLDGLEAPVVVSSPNAGAVVLALVLAALRNLLEAVAIHITACLAISSHGREGITELARQTAELLNARPLEPRYFDRQVAFNVLAQVGPVDDAGHSAAERQLVDDLHRLLAIPQLAISATCLQVPVFFGDSFSVSIKTRQPCDLAAVRLALDSSHGIECVEADDYPTAVADAVGQDAVYVGRLRNGIQEKSELNLWIVSDNARKGAALNAVQLAELLIKSHL